MSRLRIHHLNCGTHEPFGGRLFDGRSKGLRANLCTHCLLVETASELVLVDTGYGLRDVAASPRRLSHLWPAVLQIRLRESDTARRQIEALGFRADDVRHIVLTHLDFDHAGGVSDFPAASVHVLRKEYAQAQGRQGLVGHQRYRPRQWEHDVRWTFHPNEGDRWFGFSSVRALPGAGGDILFIPLPGHTDGHAGIAINTNQGWLLHAGDAYLNHGQLKAHAPRIPLGLGIYERIMATDALVAHGNLERLRELKNNEEVRIFCSHDTAELEGLIAQAKAQNP